MKINEGVLEGIVQSVLNATAIKRRDEHKAAAALIGSRILDRIIKFDGSESIMKQLPAHYFEAKSQFIINVAEDSSIEAGGIASIVDFTREVEFLFVICEERPMFALSYYAAVVFDASDSDIIAFRREYDAYKKLDAGMWRHSNELKAMLKPFKTVKALLKALPEFETLISEQYLDRDFEKSELEAIRNEDIKAFVQNLAA